MRFIHVCVCIALCALASIGCATAQGGLQITPTISVQTFVDAGTDNSLHGIRAQTQADVVNQASVSSDISVLGGYEHSFAEAGAVLVANFTLPEPGAVFYYLEYSTGTTADASSCTVWNGTAFTWATCRSYWAYYSGQATNLEGFADYLTWNTSCMAEHGHAYYSIEDSDPGTANGGSGTDVKSYAAYLGGGLHSAEPCGGIYASQDACLDARNTYSCLMSSSSAQSWETISKVEFYPPLPD